MEWQAPASYVSGWANTAAAVPRLAPSLSDEVLAGLHYVERGDESPLPKPVAMRVWDPLKLDYEKTCAYVRTIDIISLDDRRAIGNFLTIAYSPDVIKELL